MYEDAGATGTFLLDYILTPEGELQDLGSLVEFHYNLKDHLGNTRVDFDKNGINQQIDYYPFGMAFNSSLGGNNKYLFNGKELQDEQLGGVNLDWYDYGARFYDPALGRFHTQDRFAEDFAEWSPYHYANNNPILNIDINGDSSYTFNVATEALTWVSETGGSESQIVNFINEDGSAYTQDGDPVTAAIEGSEVFVTDARDGWLVSGYDPVADLSEGYNSATGYEYSMGDLVLRHKLKGSVLAKAIANNESVGNAQPISSQAHYDAYVDKWGTDKAFWYALEGGYYGQLLPGVSSALADGQRALSRALPQSNSFSLPHHLQVSPIKNSWNRYLHANKGSGKSVQEAHERTVNRKHATCRLL